MRHHKNIVPDDNSQPPIEKVKDSTVSYADFNQDEQLSLLWMSENYGSTDGEDPFLGDFGNPDFRLVSDINITNMPSTGQAMPLNPPEEGGDIFSKGTASSSESFETPLGALIPVPVSPENPWRTSFVLSEAKREEVAKAIREVLLPVSSMISLKFLDYILSLHV
jgi:hypothetical protein